MTTVLWYRQDLRVSDHDALLEACARGMVVPVFVWHPQGEGAWPLGGAQRWWLDGSLRALDAELRSRGSRLVVRSGDPSVELAAVAADAGARSVLCSRRFEPAAMREEERVTDALERRGVRLERCGSTLLFDPFVIRSGSGTPYKVFTPFWRACLASTPPARPRAAPARIAAPASWPAGVSIDSLSLKPTIPWDSGMRESWRPGEVAGRVRLSAFVSGPVGAYAGTRDVPGVDGTSMLSP